MISETFKRTLRGLVCAALIGVPLLCTAAQATVSISADETSNMICTGGTCSPTAKKAVLNAAELTHMLAHSNVEVATAGDAVTIEITAAFGWTSAHRLTLRAGDDIAIKAPVTVAGPGRLVIVANGGDLRFFPGGRIDFWDLASELRIAGHSYVLTNSIHGLADAVAANPFGHFALTRDYDASADGTYGLSPVPTPLQGVFEGLGHTAANVAIKDSFGKCIGFFASIYKSGTARDINLTDATVYPSQKRYARGGALAGCSKGIVVNSSASGTVGGIWVGGLVGYNDGLISRSHADVAVTGRFAGGLAGVSEGVISRSYATGAVNAGFVRYKAGLVLIAGGLAAKAGTIVQSYATGAVSLDPRHFLFDREHSLAGGLVGEIYDSVTDSFATGAVQARGTSAAGGLVGRSHHASTSNSYSTGAVTGADDDASYSGGFLGMMEPKSALTDAYWDLETSGLSEGCGAGAELCQGLTGLGDAQLKSGLPAGFDPAVWGQTAAINNGYPYLLANPPPQ